MSYEIRWKRPGATWNMPLNEAWALHVPMARTEEEAGAVVTKLLKEEKPLVVTIVPEGHLNGPKAGHRNQ